MIRFGSGTYDLRDSEVSQRPDDALQCSVFFLDDTEHSFLVSKNATGGDLLERVFQHLELIERDYFGLQYVCVTGSDSVRLKWLDSKKSIKRQMLCAPFHLFFRLKFYVSEPSRLCEEFSRYQMYLQIRKDLLDGRLPCSEEAAAVLGSYAVQSEMGDFNAEEMGEDYLNGFRLLPIQSSSLIKKIKELHLNRSGQSPAEAEFRFLNRAKCLDFYGFDLFESRDGSGRPITIGVNCNGISVFDNGSRVHFFPWAAIIKVSFKRKHFLLQIMNVDDQEENVDTELSFNAVSSQNCKMLWKSCIEHHTFFRLVAPPATSARSLFHLGSRFRYSGRTEYQTMEESRRRGNSEKSFQRNSALPPSAPRSPLIEETLKEDQRKKGTDRRRTASLIRDALLRRKLLPNSAVSLLNGLLSLPPSEVNTKIVPSASSSDESSGAPPPDPRISSSSSEKSATSSEATSESATPNTQRLSVEENSALTTSLQSLTVDKPSEEERLWNNGNGDIRGFAVNFRRPSPSPYDSATLINRPAVRQRQPIQSMSDDESSRIWKPMTRKSLLFAEFEKCPQNNNNSVRSRTNGSLLKPPAAPIPLNRRPMDAFQRRSVNGNLYERSHSPIPQRVVSAPNPPSVGGRLHRTNGTATLLTNPPQMIRRPPSTSPPNSLNGEENVVIRLIPDSNGRFGFNVVGGTDSNHPVIVSRINSGSPADRSFPRLNEGDQLLKINGQDVSQWPYSSVVSFIRSLRSFGEMSLTIKPNVYRYGEFDETENQFGVPEIPHVAETVPHSDKLAQSLLFIRDAIQSDSIGRQFEQLYRKKPGQSMEESHLPSNIRKNRYRDVRPYDSTRVILERAPSGDYINANHVNMEIPSTGIVNRYIATQGPLAHTSGDFWHMVWEQSATTIVMLTTIVEKGRIKCHQYWPNRRETAEYGQLVITNMAERADRYCQYRELSIRNKLSREERRVTQMQYTAWPDHGVPENPHHFIEFVDEVRRMRNGSLDPVIVHCSAGIGRTGVLILMETAACLIESNEPVYPLDIVRTMRDQRPMLIQTVEQYRFVCECVLRAHTENIIKPLAEYEKCR